MCATRRDFSPEELRRIRERARRDTAASREELDQYEQMDFETFFFQYVTDKSMKTMCLEYKPSENCIKVQVIKRNPSGDSVSKVYRFSSGPDYYLTFCKNTLGFNPDRKYNDSSNRIFKGVLTRIFAVTRPYKPYPLVVISTAKEPPMNIDTLSEHDEARLRKVFKGNFIVAGKTGAGKTYLLNFLLNKYFPDNKRLCIIEEFNEIIEPNEFTDILLTPPRTPGQVYNDLQFLTEQSNLMRYDTIIVSECKSDETWSMIMNMASGTQGIFTLHGDSPQNALKRLKTLCMLAKPNLSPTVVEDFIKSAVDYVVYVEDSRVKAIEKLNSVNNGNFQLEAVEVGDNSF